jgi:hypothetical protein
MQLLTAVTTSLRFSGSFVIFITKIHYLGGKNSARFIPQRGVAAKRYLPLARNSGEFNILRNKL